MDGVPDVFILHGLGDQRESMRPFAHAMGSEVRCLGVDLVGHGDRPLPDQFDMPSVARDVVAQIESLNLDRPYLFGYSFGGRVALYIARHFPERVRGVCSFASRFFLEPPMLDLTAAHFNPDSERVQTLRRKQRRLFGLIHQWLLRVRNDTPLLLEEDLRAIDLPVLVLSGADDSIVPAEDQILMEKMLPNSRLVLFEGSAHPAWSAPFEAIGRAMTEFVRDVEAGKFSR